MIVHLGVYGAYGKTMPACNGKVQPFEFSATDKWAAVTCRRCVHTDAWRKRRRAHLHAIIQAKIAAVAS
jgi:hypothetical protein